MLRPRWEAERVDPVTRYAPPPGRESRKNLNGLGRDA